MLVNWKQSLFATLHSKVRKGIPFYIYITHHTYRERRGEGSSLFTHQKTLQPELENNLPSSHRESIRFVRNRAKQLAGSKNSPSARNLIPKGIRGTRLNNCAHFHPTRTFWQHKRRRRRGNTARASGIKRACGESMRVTRDQTCNSRKLKGDFH